MSFAGFMGCCYCRCSDIVYEEVSIVVLYARCLYSRLVVCCTSALFVLV